MMEIIYLNSASICVIKSSTSTGFRMTTEIKIVKSDVPWIEKTVLDARSWGDELLLNGDTKD